MQAKTTERDAHVVCGECGTRWTVSYQEGRTTPPTPRKCRNPKCNATWLELPMFMDRADADRAPRPHGE
jgi:hypothetical protein